MAALRGFLSVFKPAGREDQPSWASMSSTTRPSVQNSYNDDFVAQDVALSETDPLHIPPGLDGQGVPVQTLASLQNLISGAQPAPGEHKPSWASLSSSAQPSAQNSWCDDSFLGHDPFCQADMLYIPSGLQQRQVVPTDAVVAANARLALENEMLRMQVMQAATAHVTSQVAMPPAHLATPDPLQHMVEGASADVPVRMTSTGTIDSMISAASGVSTATNVTISNQQTSRTTVMLRDLPSHCTRDMVIGMLDAEGFNCQYDFVYMPIDFTDYSTCGYVFVNLVSPEMALECWKVFDGYSKWLVPSKKACSVNWSSPMQGLEEHVERFRNNPVMHHSVPEEYQPQLLKAGIRVPFPQPTKKLRAPRVRPGRSGVTMLLARDDDIQ